MESKRVPWVFPGALISPFLDSALGPSQVCYCPLMRETKTAIVLVHFPFLKN